MENTPGAPHVSTPDPHRHADVTLPSESPSDLNRKILEPLAQPVPAVASDKTVPDGPPGSSSAPFEVPSSLPEIPGYAIESEIARGGMGVVYRAWNLRLNRPAAIKMIIGGKYHDPMARVRFMIEAEVVAQLDHPHVVHVHEFGTHENLPFFALEFVGGGTLAAKVSREGKPPPRASAELVLKLAEGIAAAHAKGIIHRDLKPANVLLTEAGEPKIVDFGLAKMGQSDMTATGEVIGTPSYMSPEQAAGRIREVGVPTDVYALGAILFELLTGQPAFKGESSMETIQQVLNREPVRPRAVDPAIPRDLETICLKCLEKNAKLRYATATELAVDLRAYLEGRPILARPVGRLERAVKWVKRNPVVAGAAVAVVTALTLGTTVSYLKYRDAEEQKGIAEDKRLAADKAREKAEENERAERWGRYRSNIAAASAAMQLHNSGAARMALDDAPMEHRNWEWNYLHSQLDAASLVLPEANGKIKSFVLSPSGRQIAICREDRNEVYLFDVVTGKLDAVLRGHSGAATSAAYRPDGKQVATGSIDRTIRLWDPATGRQTALLKPEAAPSNLDQQILVNYNSDGSRIVSSVSRGGNGMSRLWDAANAKEIAVLGQWQTNSPSAAFSPDGKRVAVASGEFVRVCDVVTGRQLALLGPHEEQVKHLTYSPDGKRIASAAVINVIHLWDGESGKEIAVLPGYTSNVLGVKFSPDGSRLISGSSFPDTSAHLWDAATGRLLGTLKGHKNEIWAMDFDASGKLVATGSLDQIGRIWDGRTGQLIASLGGHTGPVKHVNFNPDGTRVVTASDDATIRLWDARTGELIGVLRGSNGQFSPNESLAFKPDGSRLVSGSYDGTMRIWDMNLAERNGILRGHTSFVYDVAFNADGEQVASASWDGTARLWDATTCRQTGLLKHEKEFITSLAYSGNSRQLVTVERDGCVTLWDLISQNKARFPAQPFSRDSDSRATFNPSGTMLAAACQDGMVRLWDVAGGKEIAQLKGHEKVPIDVAFHPDGSLLATSGSDGTVRLWDVSTKAPLAVLRGHTGRVWRVAFSIDGKLLASGGNDRTICFWDAQTHERLAVIPLGSIVYGVAFSPDGTRLAAGCADNTVRLVDVGSRQQVAELRGHSSYVHAVAWSPDGTRLVSGSGDFTLRIWDSLSVQERAKRAEMTQKLP
jgi:WD40 repeat protein